MIIPRCIAIWSCIYLFDGTFASRPTNGRHALVEELLTNYGSTQIRPGTHMNQPTSVFTFLLLQQIVDLSERDQTLKSSVVLSFAWTDDYLTWNETQYPSVEFIDVSCNDIWTPDVHLFETVKDDFEFRKDLGCTVTANGTVYLVVPAILFTSCRINARKFPFDTQHCSLRFAVWNKLVDEVVLATDTQYLTIPSGEFFIENGIWELNNVTAGSRKAEYEPGSFYSEVIFTIHLKRHPLFYCLSFILPCGLLSGMNLLVFMLPTESGEKVSLGITNLLSLVLFQQLIGDTLPPASGNMPIMMYYFSPMICLGCLSIFTAVLVARLHHQDGSQPLPHWLRRLIRLDPIASSAVSPSATLTAPPSANKAECEEKITNKAERGGANNNFAALTKVVPFNYGDDKAQDKYSTKDHSEDWKKCAYEIDRHAFHIASFTTFVAVLITMILLAVE